MLHALYYLQMRLKFFSYGFNAKQNSEWKKAKQTNKVQESGGKLKKKN